MTAEVMPLREGYEMDIEPCYVVLGATGGIGSELCRQLCASGAHVVGASRNPKKVRELAETIGVRPFTLDATDSEQVAACLADAQQTFGRVDGVANCVGSLLLKPAHLTLDTEWQNTLAINLTTAFAAVSAGARAMLQTGGSIVLVSSAAARVGLANHEAIAAAKAGIIGLTFAAAASYAERGIRVNCVAPGLVRTPLTARLIANEASLKASVAMHPLGRMGEPSDVAATIAWMLDPKQGWITGQVLGVDGGLATVRTRGKS
jgi:NAD(P)-dependent dehydrogenase (short-subunit alcohol dehydrogenase family)